MEFIWHDGGRAASGYVGIAGDCVTRSISIATGLAYRDVYKAMGDAAGETPRNGVITPVADQFLQERGWIRKTNVNQAFDPDTLPGGVVVCDLSTTSDRGHHFCTVVDHVIYDTWNATDDGDYVVRSYWTPPPGDATSNSPGFAAKVKVSREQEMNQKEFDRILHRLRSLDNTAKNAASTEGEKRNALRMMQTMMLRHNLSRDDISENDSIDSMQFTRMTCHVNGKRGCTWEKQLAMYVTTEVFNTVQPYTSTRSKRTCVCFYGPKSDTANCVALFRELLVTIAASARLRYGGYSRGSGASYAEGYVEGLPRSGSTASDDGGSEAGQQADEAAPESQLAVQQTRSLLVKDAAVEWLATECSIRLHSTRGYGRSQTRLGGRVTRSRGRRKANGQHARRYEANHSAIVVARTRPSAIFSRSRANVRRIP